MGEFAIVVVAVFVFVVVTIAKGVRIVPQGEEWIVERLGKYHTTLLPGLNIIIPYLDQVRYKLVTKDIILDVQEQEVITKDNAVILTNAIAFIKVTDPIKAVYGVTDFSEAIRNMIMTTLRSIIGEMTLDEALSNRDKIKARLRESMCRRGHRLGSDGQVGRDSGHQSFGIHAKSAWRRRPRPNASARPW
jgi:regulator of protease activity HflC (stomatin/prohibitin superfamily)